MLLTLLMMALNMSMMFLFMNHPLSMGVMLLLQAMTVSMITGLLNYTFWFSYILFLVMVGGMLILFIYMTSVASNEKFNFSVKLMVTSSIVIMSVILMSIAVDHFFMNMEMFNYELTKTSFSSNISMKKYINYPNNSLMYLMITYLLITLIMVVKTTNISYGPLRQKL